MSLVLVKFKFIEVSVLFFALELKRMQRKLLFSILRVKCVIRKNVFHRNRVYAQQIIKIHASTE